MKLYLKRIEDKGWIEGEDITKYNHTEKIIAFCSKYNIKKCDFKIEGIAIVKIEIEGLPALFG